VWQLRKGSTITPNVLKWLADTIRNYHCQLSQSAPDWMTELDRYARRGSHLRQLYSIPSNILQRANTDVPIRWQTKRIFSNTMEMILISIVVGILRIHGTTGGWTGWALSGDQRIPHVFKVQRGSIDVSIPTWEWTLFDCLTVPIG
jgi:hypothetical protein